jgi:hypothetical protein
MDSSTWGQFGYNGTVVQNNGVTFTDAGSQISFVADRWICQTFLFGVGSFAQIKIDPTASDLSRQISGFAYIGFGTADGGGIANGFYIPDPHQDSHDADLEASFFPTNQQTFQAMESQSGGGGSGFPIDSPSTPPTYGQPYQVAYNTTYIFRLDRLSNGIEYTLESADGTAMGSALRTDAPLPAQSYLSFGAYHANANFSDLMIGGNIVPIPEPGFTAIGGASLLALRLRRRTNR